MNSKLILVVILLLVVAGGYYFISGNMMGEDNRIDPNGILVEDDAMIKKDDAMVEDEKMVKEDDAMMKDDKAVEDGDKMMEDSTVKTFEVGGGGFYFDPDEITVTEGDTVKIVFTNEGGVHDWVIDEFDARTPIIQAGEVSEIEFVADQAGSFEYYCSVGNHREQGMWGTLIVEPK